QHRPMMRACGYTPQQIEAVGNWRASTLFNDRQRALLAYVDQAARGDVDDATFAAFEKFFDTQEIVEITITVDTYVGTALFTRALRIKIEDEGHHAGDLDSIDPAVHGAALHEDVARLEVDLAAFLQLHVDLA